MTINPSLPRGALPSPSRQLLGLVGWLALTFGAAALGAIASINAAAFYSQLVRPPWAPPGWLFGPVWSVLYLLMGVSAWVVWRVRSLAGVRTALTLFVIQLVFNAGWSWLFFVWRKGAFAFAEVLLLWCFIAATIIAFGRVRRLAAVLLLPYLGWVTFATAPTLAVWRLNPQLLG